MRSFFKAEVEIIPIDEEDIVTRSIGSDTNPKDDDMDDNGWQLFG